MLSAVPSDTVEALDDVARHLAQLLPGYWTFLVESESTPDGPVKCNYARPKWLQEGAPELWSGIVDVSFYDVVSHDFLRSAILRRIGDELLADLLDHFLTTFGGDGVGLPHDNRLSAVLAQILVTYEIEVPHLGWELAIEPAAGFETGWVEARHSLRHEVDQ